MADETPTVTPEAEEALLALLDSYRVELTAAEARRDQLMAERAAVFLRIREESGGRISLKRIAARAGVSDAAVTQQVERARRDREATPTG